MRALYEKHLANKPAYVKAVSLIVLVFVCFLILKILFMVTTYRTREMPPQDAPYRQASLPTEERIDDLLSRMTLEEKIGQMALVEKNSLHDIEDISSYGIGGLLSGAGAKPEDNTTNGWRKMVSGYVDASKTARLGIPVLYGVDAIHGHSNVPDATIFPHLIGLGASGDATLVENVARATAEEMALTGIHWSFSPTLDMPQDIRWGRTYETFSDDPALVSKLGVAYLRGLQRKGGRGDDSKIFVLGTPKHFVGGGAMKWGSSSNKDFKIDQGTTPSDETALRTEYLPPFKAVVDDGALSMMVGLNSWGDTKLSADAYLITDVLKKELGFDGFVVSDWYGVYEIPGGDYNAAVTAINAGVDMVMLPFDYKTFARNVNLGVKSGDIKEDRIDDAVRRILRAKFTLGLFDASSEALANSTTMGSAVNRNLAREAVAKSLVVLKNKNGALPIAKDVKSIRVAGSAADNVGRQMGAWSVEWQGIDGNWLPNTTSILAGIRGSVSNTTMVEYDRNGNFPSETDIADIGIAVVGEAPYAEGWGDKEIPELGPEDREVIRRLKTVSKKVIVVIVSGRPLIVTNDIGTWDALVAAWLPGSEGSGVADVLLGMKPSTGRLPLPWPAHVGQLPIKSNGETADGSSVLFPRSYGL